MERKNWLIAAMVGVMALVLTAGPLSAASTVRITPDYLRKIYRENLTLYKLASSDSATIIFSRGSLKRLEDLRKLHEAGQDAFVGVLLNHLTRRCELVRNKLKDRPLSAESRRARQLPRIYRTLLAELESMKKRETTTDDRWTEPIQETTQLLQLMERQIEGPGTSFSTPDND